MRKRTRFGGIFWALLLAVAFTGSGLHTIATAMGVQVSVALYAVAAVSAGLAAIAAISFAGGVIAGMAGLAGVGAYAMTDNLAMSNLRTYLAQWRTGPVESALAASGGRVLLLCAAALGGMVFFVLLYRRELASVALVLLGAMLMSSHAMSNTASIEAALPGLFAAALSFAFAERMPRNVDAARTLIPVGLAVLLALMLLPAGRVTWEPMEELAQRVRNVFEQYFNFTHERIAFSLGEVGYNHGGEVGGEIVAMLGGPAQPDAEPVMRVKADGEVLLRGTIRATYTGYSWVDIAPKNRYLYYDITHRTVRARVFDQAYDSPADAFHSVSGEVELLNSGTSTLFVPGRLSEFRMDLENAVYYNSSGEMFMARSAEAGDVYGFTALTADHGDALRQATLRGESAADEQYASIIASSTALPDGIDRELYALTARLITDAQTSYDRARAIEHYLRQNMRYALDVVYPPNGRDFASWFVLDSREGYCSYFATAMAVMGRMAGLPTRYVEGYYARPEADGTAVLTGQDAHAWAEVYFRGVGWIPFDATNGGPAGDEGDGGSNDGADDTDGGGGVLPDAPTPTPLPISGEDTQETPEPADEPARGETPQDEGGQNNVVSPWLGPGLLLLLFIALAMAWIIRRLKRTDPAWLCAQTRQAQQAAMIVYRANLTLLSHMGQVPISGETPEAFVERVAKAFNNPDYAHFAQAVALDRYARKPVQRADIETGLRAYQGFKKAMRRAEALRFAVTRVTRGLGDFETIP